MSVPRPQSEDQKVPRYMCIRVLDDGETERATHFRVVDANDYDAIVAELQRVRSLNTVVYKDGTSKTVACPTWEYEGDPNYLVTISGNREPEEPWLRRPQRKKPLGNPTRSTVGLWDLSFLS